MTVRDCVDLLIDDHRIVYDAVKAAAGALAAFIEPLVERMRRGGRLVYVGAGTSGRLGVLDAAECLPTFQAGPGQVIGVIAGGDAALRLPSEGREDEPEGAAPALAELRLGPRDTVLGIAAGGTTPFVLGAVRIAKAAGAATALLVCVPVPRLAGCDQVIELVTGAELLTGSTRLKAGSATKLALNIISTVMFVRLGKVYSNLMVDLRATNDKLRDRAIRILVELCPELSREAAASALDAARGELKSAIVMQRLDLGRDEAVGLLESNGGVLRAALESGPAAD